MLARLERALVALPQWLDDPGGWNTLDVNYHPPRVERLYRNFEDGRVFLHCIHPCEPDEALVHPHPWPSAMLVLSGTYRTRVGYAPGLQEPIMVYESMVTAWPKTDYRYVMDHPDGWHAVMPEGGPVYTVMVTGPKWKRPQLPVTECAAGKLKGLPDERKEDLLRTFQLYMNWRQAQFEIPEGADVFGTPPTTSD